MSAPKVATIVLSTASGEFGGTEQNAAELALALHAHSVAVTLVCVGPRIDQLAEIVSGVTMEVVQGTDFSDIPYRFWRDLLARHQSDLVIRSKNCIGLASWRLDLAARLHGRRYVSWEHHTAKPPGVDPSVPRRDDLMGSAKQALRFWLHFNTPHHTIAVSEAVRSAMIRHYRCRSGAVSVVYPGIDFSSLSPDHSARADLRRRWGVPDSALLVGCFGRLAPHKNYDVVLRAIARARDIKPDVELWCAIGGVGQDRNRLEQIAIAEGVHERVIFAGWQADRRQFLSALDVLALPSSDEGLGLVLIEGVACGATAFATRVGGMPEVFGIEAPLYILDDADPLNWAQRILQWGVRDAQVRASLWRRLDYQIRHRFDGDRQWEDMVRVVLGTST